MLTKFPLELLEVISGYCTKKACLALMTTCHSICAIAERALYNEIVLHDGILLSFIRALHKSMETDRRIRCNLIKKLVIRSFSRSTMAKANPWLCSLLLLMRRVNSLTISCDGETADILFMFMSRSGLVRRLLIPKIPTLIPIKDGPSDTSAALNALKSLEIAGNLLFLKLAQGRSIKSITSTTVAGISEKTGSTLLKYIRGESVAYNELRSLSIAAFVTKSDDVIWLLSQIKEISPHLEELELRLFSTTIHVSTFWSTKVDE